MSTMNPERWSFDHLRRSAAIHEMGFLLQSAITASNLMNRVGLGLRAPCLIVGLLAATRHTGSLSWRWVLFVSVVIGYLFAAMEAYGQTIIDWLAESDRRPVRWLGRSYVAARERAVLSLSGVLQVAGGAVMVGAFAGPLALDFPSGWRELGALSMVGFVAIAISQVVSDRGYFNLNPDQHAEGIIKVARWLLPTAAAGVAAVILWTSPTPRTAWEYIVVGLLFTASLGVAFLTEVIQMAALASYRLSQRSREDDIRKLVSVEFHRLKVDLGKEFEITSDPEAKRVLQRIRAETETLRHRFESGQQSETVDGLLATVTQIADRDGILKVDADESLRQSVLRREDAVLLRHILLDLIANAKAAIASSLRACLEVEQRARGWSSLGIRVSDDGDGFKPDAAMNIFPTGSSRWVLDELCQGRRGRLSYDRADGWTTADARFQLRIAK